MVAYIGLIGLLENAPPLAAQCFEESYHVDELELQSLTQKPSQTIGDQTNIGGQGTGTFIKCAREQAFPLKEMR
jgi:hypothetical protein